VSENKKLSALRAINKEGCIGEIYKEYINIKSEYGIGKRPKDLMEEFMDNELKEYMAFKNGNALLYDAII
jgi:hypothetical protein